MNSFRKLGLFVGDGVGRQLLDAALQYHADKVSLLVFEDEAKLREFGESPQDGRLSASCIRTHWSPDGTVERAAIGHDLPDVIFLAWWPYLLRNEHLGLARETVLNVHPGYLPYCKGKDPNFWAIVEECPFGVTIHHVDLSIDGGEIAFQAEIPVTWEDTGASLYQKAIGSAVDLFLRSLPAILCGDIPRIPQPVGTGSRHFRRELDRWSRLDLDSETTVRELLNRLRARTFAPHPGCRFTDGGKVYEVRISINEVRADASAMNSREGHSNAV